MKIYKKNIKNYLFLSVFLSLFLYMIGNWVVETPAEDIFTKINTLLSLSALRAFVSHPIHYLFSFHVLSLWMGLMGFLIGLMAYSYSNDQGVYRNNEEHGSARHATVDEISRFADQEEENNIILTEQGRMGLFNAHLPFHFQKNKNLMCVGGPGSGKTYTLVKPNLMQMNASFIVTDPKGLLVHETGKMFEEEGKYKVKVFDLNTLSNSNMFNVFKYIKTELDIDRVLEAITEGTKEGDRQGEDFWIKAEALLIRSIIAFLWFDGKDNNYLPHLGMVADMLRLIKRKDPKVPSEAEKWFEDQNALHPDNYAYRQWSLFNDLYEAETRANVLGVAAARYAVFDHDQVRDLIREDNMDIEQWNEEKTAVFIAIPETSSSYNFLAAIFLATIMETLRHKADDVLKGKVQRKDKKLLHVRFIIDEFANIGRIPNIDKALASFRSREMSFMLILQSLDQLKTMYKHGWATLIDVCDSFLFLGGNEKETTNYLSQRAGKQTLSIRNHNRSNGGRNSGSESHQKQGRDLFTPDEIGRLQDGDALLFINGQHVFQDKKFTVDKHPRATLLANHPQDKQWYDYKRPMNGIEKFIGDTKPEEILDHGTIE
ncbi:VirD4-like conjugal transfer protein, CD1115 family [Lactococcus garvieae]|uniref:VirD4-like conjugal transfer protein, CD1115 family n=1 Tax=Lactococcus garvieae TaxID=1363 RepID=UPI003853E295